jgi:hypothetical protein
MGFFLEFFLEFLLEYCQASPPHWGPISSASPLRPRRGGKQATNRGIYASKGA